MGCGLDRLVDIKGGHHWGMSRRLRCLVLGREGQGSCEWEKGVQARLLEGISGCLSMPFALSCTALALFLVIEPVLRATSI